MELNRDQLRNRPISTGWQDAITGDGTNLDAPMLMTAVGAYVDASTPTTLNGAVSAGATQIVVVSGTGIADADTIRVGSGGAAEYRTVASGGGTTTLTLTTALSADHANGEGVAKVVWGGIGASTTKKWRIPTRGAKKVTVTVKPQIVGAPTLVMYSALADGLTKNSAAAADTTITLTDNTLTEAARTLTGESFVILLATTTGGQDVYFDVAEFRLEPA